MTGDMNLDMARIPDPFAKEQSSAIPMGAIPKSASPTRARRRALVAGAAGAGLLYEALGLAFFKMRPNLGTTSPGLLVLELALPLVVGVAALAGAMRRGPLGLGEPTARLASRVVSALLVFAVATLVAFPRSEPVNGAFWTRTTTCIFVSAALAAGPLIAATLALRNAFAAGATWRTAAVGVLCGALAASTIALVCPEGGALHVLIGHGTMMVIMGGLAAAIVSRVARI